MKKTFGILNAVFIPIALILGYCYYEFGGLLLKGIASGGFVTVGLINLIYAVRAKAKVKFPILMFCGLFICMVADVILNIEFIPGALIFAVGHIFYYIAYLTEEKFFKRDIVPTSILIIATILILTAIPFLVFEPELMRYVCILYAIIISFMVGKAISNYIGKRKTKELIIMIGSICFFFSDLMLVFDMFADVGEYFGELCLGSYYPAQCLLAFSIFKSVDEK